MNKSELIDSVAASTGESKRLVNDVLDELINTVQSTVQKGEKISLPGFGTFERRERSARDARNPQTGETIRIQASKVPAWKAGATIKQLVNGKK